MRVSGDHGTPRTDVIHITAIVGIDKIGTFAALEKNRITTDGAKCPYRRVNAARNMLLGASE
jgi:hypothetical protein